MVSWLKKSGIIEKTDARMHTGSILHDNSISATFLSRKV